MIRVSKKHKPVEREQRWQEWKSSASGLIPRRRAIGGWSYRFENKADFYGKEADIFV